MKILTMIGILKEEIKIFPFHRHVSGIMECLAWFHDGLQERQPVYKKKLKYAGEGKRIWGKRQIR